MRQDTHYWNFYLLIIAFWPHINLVQSFVELPLKSVCQVWERRKTDLNFRRTLAAEYVIDISETSETWRGYQLDSINKEDHAVGYKATSSLYDTWSEELPIASFVISARIQDNTAIVKLDKNAADDHVDSVLIAILSRIMVQSIKKFEDSTVTSFELPNEEAFNITHDHASNEFVLALFRPLIDSTENIELSEMVSQAGDILGMVPRMLVHLQNLLHRGIGVLVTKDRSILLPPQQQTHKNSQPDIFVHRRTDTKQIFPSLYDMFVGGVSMAREDARLTASREVAEELGLGRALSDPSMLSDVLFDCTICTSYNRCVVTVFCCNFLSKSEGSIALQEEEVAWGDFVNYDTVVASADLSMQRLIEKGEWPGGISSHMASRIAKSKIHEDDSCKWREWDYVPDGLLVWEAWLEWQNRNSGGSQSV